MDSVRSFLMASTGALHRRLDACASAFDLNTDPGTREFLIFMWRGCAPSEAELTRAGAIRVLKEWPHRRRAKLLEADLGGRLAVPRPRISYASEAEVWGARMLARSTGVAARSAFIRNSVDCGFWPKFIARLGEADRRLADRDGIAAGARKCFTAFLVNNACPDGSEDRAEI